MVNWSINSLTADSVYSNVTLNVLSLFIEAFGKPKKVVNLLTAIFKSKINNSLFHNHTLVTKPLSVCIRNYLLLFLQVV